MDWKTFWNTSPQVSDADFCRQVGRTFLGAAYTEGQLDAVSRRILSLLEPAPGATLLDLGCGNGLITSRLVPRFRSVTAVDFSQPLIDAARAHFPGIDYRLGDVVELDGILGEFDCAHLGAALQHFDESQATRMLFRLSAVLKPDARIVFSDVADGDRVWDFYRGITGKIRYAAGVVTRRPIIGMWWTPANLVRVANHAGWSCTLEYQDEDLPNHFFRYDAILTRTLT